MSREFCLVRDPLPKDCKTESRLWKAKVVRQVLEFWININHRFVIRTEAPLPRTTTTTTTTITTTASLNNSRELSDTSWNSGPIPELLAELTVRNRISKRYPQSGQLGRNCFLVLYDHIVAIRSICDLSNEGLANAIQNKIPPVLSAWWQLLFSFWWS